MDILDQIKSSADVKRLPEERLPELCDALRREIIQTVSSNGGHLASSLGAVELTVALHRVYDTAADRIVFDVGHQCYAHKLLTGRRAEFSTLRQLDGLAGFPRPAESPDDASVSGHASTSVSVALGMARARSLLGESCGVAAVIGDGALTGGVAYEGLADCGASGEGIVVVLNDNAMSIRENVGGMARVLAQVRVRPGYLAFKRFYRRTVGKTQLIYRGLHRVKEWVKDLLLPDNMFEDLGFYYLGPIDGHDLPTLIRTLRYAREMNVPVLLHIRTRKGKGYAPAEENPALYHGVGPFDPAKGLQSKAEQSFSSCFGKAMCDSAEKDERVTAITAAMADGTGLSPFAERFPRRFFDVGIAEQHAAALAAGMAARGLKPVFAVYSTFLQRAWDMLFHDISLSGEHVVLAVDRAGLVGQDGATHQGAFDVGYLLAVPGMKLWAPSNFAELEAMLGQALDESGPCALRYPRGGEGPFRDNTAGAEAVLLRRGGDVTLLTYGILVNEALAAAETLAKQGIRCAVVKLNRLDRWAAAEPLWASLAETGRLLALEDAAEAGSVGTRVLAECALRGIKMKCAARKNLGAGVIPQGSVPELTRRLKLDAAGVVEAVEMLLHEENQN